MVKIISKELGKANSPLLKGTPIITAIRFTKKKRVKNEEFINTLKDLV